MIADGDSIAQRQKRWPQQASVTSAASRARIRSYVAFPSFQ